jgi:small subunit ribosomal protein S20
MRNRIAKKIIKTYSKRCLTAAAQGKFDQAEADFRLSIAKLDKAGYRRVLHPNTARRRKSSLARAYAAAKAKAKPSAA